MNVITKYGPLVVTTTSMVVGVEWHNRWERKRQQASRLEYDEREAVNKLHEQREAPRRRSEDVFEQRGVAFRYWEDRWI